MAGAAPLKFSPQALLVTLLILAAWATGLFFNGYSQILYFPAIMALLALCCIVVIPALRLGVSIPVSAPAVFLFGLWLYITLSLTWSTVPFSSFITWLVFLSLPLCFFMFAMPVDPAPVATARAALTAGLVILALWTCIQSFISERPAWPMADPNNLASLLNLGLLPAVALAVAQRERRYMVLTAIFFAGVVATQSRGGFLCFLAASVPLCITLRPDISANRGYCLKLAAAGVVLFAVMQLHAQAPLAQRLMALGAHDPNVSARFAIWKATAGMIAQHLWRGTGFGTFYLYYPAFRLPADDSMGSWAHNDPLQLWAETGPIAPLLLYGLIFTTAWRSAKAMRMALPVERPVIAGLSCGLLAVALHMHMEFDFYIMPTLIVCGTWLAALHKLTNSRSVVIEVAGWQRTFLTSTVIVAAGLIALCGGSSAAGQYFRTQAQTAIARGDINGFLDANEKARRFGPATYIDPDVQLAGFYIDMLANPVAGFAESDHRTMFDSAGALLDHAEKLNPAWSEIDRKRARLYYNAPAEWARDGREYALKSWQIAIKKNPMNFRARQELAQAYLAKGDALNADMVLSAGLRYPYEGELTKTYSELLLHVEPLARVQQEYKDKGKSP